MKKELTKLKKTILNFFEDFKYFLKNTWLLFKENIHEVSVFILLCASISVIGTLVLKDIFFSLVLGVNEITYIAPTNLLVLMQNKVTWFLLLVFVIMIAFMSIFEIAGLLHAFSMSQVGRDTSIVSMCRSGFRTCLKALNPQNWMIIVFLIILLPLTKVLPLSSSVFKLIIPGFIYQTIDYTVSYTYLYRIFYTLLISFMTVFIFSINIFVLQKKNFNDSCKRSYKLQKGHILNTFFTMMFFTIIMNFVINSIASIVVINVREITSFFGGSSGIVTKSSEIGFDTYILRQFLKSLIAPALNNAALTVLFYKYLEDKKLLSTLNRDIFKEGEPSLKSLVLVLTVYSFLIITSLLYLNNKYAFLVKPVDTPIVCAHRGDNVNAPENTMPAFELAAMENLSWVELDVHQTKDGVIVCNHDSDISRTTGVKLSIHDTNYAELKKYIYGDWMPGNYSYVTMPTLKEVLSFCYDHNIHVQVELKGHRDDVNYEENVLSVINETDMHDQVMIIAQDYRRLERINELDPTIIKGYCMAFAYGKLDDIECTNNVTIEESNVTPELVEDLHSRGVKVFCWTVDSEDSIQYLVSCDVDVIGTDNPTMVLNALEKMDYSGGLRRVFHIIMNIIANMDK